MKIGAISYSTKNIGDDIQTLAGLKLLGINDYKDLLFTDRDKIHKEKREMKILGNAWWDFRGVGDKVDMLPISMHFNSITDFDWLKKHEPIGCRDLYSVRLLKANGIEAYYSGCITLTLPKYTGKRNDNIVYVGKTPKEFETLTTKSKYKKMNVEHYITDEELINDPLRRLEEAQKRLDIYKKARLVITSRLHVLLPCIAFGTPVVFHRVRDFKRFEGYEWIPEHKTISLDKDYTIEKPEDIIRKLKQKVKQFKSR